MTKASLALLETEEDINPLLVEALLDENKFAAVHILLYRRTAQSGYPIVDLTNGAWQGLKVQWNDTEGRMTYENNDLVALHQYWLEKLTR